MNHHELFKGLADQTRLRVVVLLLEREMCVCDLLGVLRLPQSTVSRHMTRLKSFGLVIDRRVGKWVHYKLAETAVVGALKQVLRQQLANVEPFRSDRMMLKKYVAAGQCAAANGHSEHVVPSLNVRLVPGGRSRRRN